MAKNQALIPHDRIQKSIFVIRGQKVMLDAELAALYGVDVKALNQAVKRNLDRFPADFMFQLNADEFDVLRSQFVTSKGAPRGGRRYAPYAFTEQGVAMLSSVLRSPWAVQVNIEIMRAFVRLRELMGTSPALARKVVDMEKRYDTQFKAVVSAIKQLKAPATKPKKPARKKGLRMRIRE